MNKFYLTFDFIKKTFELDNLVHTITHGAVNDLDIEKKNLFPLVHIAVVSFEQTEGMIYFNYKIWCMGLRNILKKTSTSKFFKNDNEIDNLNETAAILNKFITRLRLQRHEHDIELVSYSSAEAIEFDFTNILDGWTIDITLSIPNDVGVC